MSIATKLTLWRLGKILLFGAIGASVTWLMQNIGLIVPHDFQWLTPTIAAVLAAIDKWVRENAKESTKW